MWVLSMCMGSCNLAAHHTPFAMKRPVLLLILIAFVFNASAQLERAPYNAQSTDLPEWVQLMYAPDPDPGVVQAAYDAYYASHRFEKNGHTQYFKRWKR